MHTYHLYRLQHSEAQRRSNISFVGLPDFFKMVKATSIRCYVGHEKKKGATTTRITHIKQG